jgi:hypothetical protein
MAMGRRAWNLHKTFLAVAVIAIGISLFTSSSLLKAAKSDGAHENEMFLTPKSPGYRLDDKNNDKHNVIDYSKSSVTAPAIHIAFSTGCSGSQEWQSYVLFHSILQSGQKGDVTRVASGCSDKELEVLIASHEKTIRTMSDRFHLHTTPNYSRVLKGSDYNFFNKPFGLRHWMQESLGFPDNKDHDETVFIILDPDQLVVRPFVQDYTEEAELWFPKNQPAKHTAVTRGHPMAQLYGFGTRWMHDVNMSAIFNSSDEASILHSNDHDKKLWNPTTVQHSFAAGPPYMAVGKDMYSIVNTWATIAVKVYQQTKDHLSEMFAYVVAAVHCGLQHQLATSFMVSSVGMGPMEGWKFIDDVWAGTATTADDNNTIVVKTHPHMIHYCQRYHLGQTKAGPGPGLEPEPLWFFSKYQLPKDFVTCEHALLKEPTYGISNMYNTSVTMDGAFHNIPVEERPRMAYMLREITVRLNDASVHYKQHHCNVSTANWNRSFVFQPKADQKSKAKKKGK